MTEKIGIQHVSNVSLARDTVTVTVRYEEDSVYSTREARPQVVTGRDIDVDHRQEIGDQPIAAVVEEVMQRAVEKANAVLAGWDRRAA
jgi:hypothetical protein